MAWEFSRVTRPTARKSYPCDAAQVVIDNAPFFEYSPDEYAAIETAKANGYRILAGEKYVKCVGVWEGQFETFRARFDLDEICLKYKLYVDD